MLSPEQNFFKVSIWNGMPFVLVFLLALCFVEREVGLTGFWFISILSLISIYHYRYKISFSPVILFSLILFIFGCYQLCWIELCKSSSYFSGAYSGYRSMAKILICESVLLISFCLIDFDKKLLTCLHRFILSAGILVISACYVEFAFIYDFNTNHRVTLDLSRATGTSYIMVLVFILSMNSLLKLKPQNFILHFCFFLFSFFSLLLTQTRAAILLYPIAWLALYLSSFKNSGIKLKNILFAFALIMALVVTISQPILQQRYQDFCHDVIAYTQGNSKTSVGARLAMFESGLKAGTRSSSTIILGQSIEERNSYITQLVANNPQLQGALPYLKVHLHNEFIETFSLKGLIGIAFLLTIIFSLIKLSVVYHSYLLAVLTGTMTIFGLSDVLLFSKATVAISICFVLAIFLEYYSHNLDKKNHNLPDSSPKF